MGSSAVSVHREWTAGDIAPGSEESRLGDSRVCNLSPDQAQPQCNSKQITTRDDVCFCPSEFSFGPTAEAAYAAAVRRSTAAHAGEGSHALKVSPSAGESHLLNGRVPWQKKGLHELSVRPTAVEVETTATKTNFSSPAFFVAANRSVAPPVAAVTAPNQAHPLVKRLKRIL
eukprot:GHVT01049910.1.p3 GENE.GHVT01049910.1~~GHVT01049910.1.p3  ORF type:complete len:172 (+),score=22.93 GHVT01049910.1:3210-3725(+)